MGFLLLVGLALAAPPAPEPTPGVRPAPRAAPLPVPPPGMPGFPVPSVHQLEGGTPVWLVERHDLPLVRIELSLRGGSLGADDPLASLALGGLLSRGTARLDEQAWSDALLDLGATASLGVGALRSWVDLEAVSGSEDAALALVASALYEPRLSRREVRRAARKRADARAEAGMSGAAVHRAATAAAVYGPDHPLGVLPLARELGAVDRRRVRAAHAELLARSGPAILVVGDTTAADILPLLEHHFGALQGRAPAPRVPPPTQVGSRVLLVDHPGAELALLTLSMPAPEAFSGDLPGAELANAVFGGGFTSRLNLRLREELGYVYSIESNLRAWPGHGRLEVETSVPVALLPATMDEILAMLWSMTATPASEAERLTAARAHLRQAAVAMGSLSGLAAPLGVRLAHDRPPEEEALRLRAVLDLTPAELARATSDLFESTDVVWVVTADAELAGAALEAGGWVPDETVSGRDLIASGSLP